MFCLCITMTCGHVHKLTDHNLLSISSYRATTCPRCVGTSPGTGPVRQAFVSVSEGLEELFPFLETDTTFLCIYIFKSLIKFTDHQRKLEDKIVIRLDH